MSAVAPMTRVVLLGASNVAISFPQIVRRLTGGLPGPLEIFAALGHGRSYCTWSRVLFRRLPGIDRCGLWADLESAAAKQPARTVALLTDVGNDLIYGSATDILERHLAKCLTALTPYQPELVITRLPLASVERLSALRYQTTKAIFFPRTRVSWPTMLERARETDRVLSELANRFSARLIDQPLAWYGFDPIHIRIRRRAEARQTILSGWPSFDVNRPLPRWSHRDLLRIRLAAPAERVLFGRRQLKTQPVMVANDVTLRLY
jgi:hypothetical protein